FVIAFAVAVALAVTATSSGLLRGLQEKAADLFPPTVIMAKPKTLNIAMVAFNARSINDDTVEQIKQFPGVSKVEPQLSLRIPLRMEIEIAGQYAVTDAVVIGVEPDTMTDQVQTLIPFQYNEQTSQPAP